MTTTPILVLDTRSMDRYLGYEGAYNALMAWLEGQGIDPKDTMSVEVYEADGVLTGQVTEQVRDEQGHKVVAGSRGEYLKRCRTVALTSMPPTPEGTST